MKGTTPEGTRNEQEAAKWVRSMFGRIARRYDLANHLLSFNLDRYWRAYTARKLRHILRVPGRCTLDICCGTGDLLLALERAGLAPVLGSDFSHPMLLAAQRKLARRGKPALLFEADALRLPLADATVDLLTVAFGFRNLVNYQAGLGEMRRVVRPGGTVAILEFSQPKNPAFAALYHFYSRRLLPPIGGALSGDRGAYAYLPESVKKFPNPQELAEAMRAAGFAQVRYELLTGGVVALHCGS